MSHKHGPLLFKQDNHKARSFLVGIYIIFVPTRQGKEDFLAMDMFFLNE
jgi:hypothetical protein